MKQTETKLEAVQEAVKKGLDPSAVKTSIEALERKSEQIRRQIGELQPEENKPLAAQVRALSLKVDSLQTELATTQPGKLEEPALVASSDSEGEPASREGRSFWDDFSGNAAVDMFYLADWNAPSDPTATGSLPHRAFDFTGGFALAFAALDINYEGDDVGVTLNLRYGEGANRLIGNADNPVFATLKQAFATWRPREDLTLDVGQFDTIYGAEVADSWQNLNYTRGALYYLMQPFYHTGLRVGYEASETVGLTFLVVNGTNNQVDFNQSPHLGAQLSLAPSDAFSTALGYYTGAGSSGFGGGRPSYDGDWEHFFDWVVNSSIGMVNLVGNADLYVGGDDGTDLYWGASLAAGLDVTDQFNPALRFEFLHDPDRFISGAYDYLTTTTLTLDYQPMPHLIIRLDNRFEYAESKVFAASEGKMWDTWFSSVLGFVVTAAPNG